MQKPTSSRWAKSNRRQHGFGQKKHVGPILEGEGFNVSKFLVLFENQDLIYYIYMHLMYTLMCSSSAESNTRIIYIYDYICIHMYIYICIYIILSTYTCWERIS